MQTPEVPHRKTSGAPYTKPCLKTRKKGIGTRDIFYMALSRTYHESPEDNSGSAACQLTPTLVSEGVIGEVIA